LNIKQRMHVRFFCKLGYLNFEYNKNSVSLSVSWPHGLNLSQYSPDSCLYTKTITSVKHYINNTQVSCKLG